MTTARGTDFGMLSDRQLNLSLTTALAWFFWASTIVCMALAYALDDWLLAALGAASTGAAATLHIRSFFCVFSHRMTAAFELGRQVERDKGHLHSMR